MKLFVDRSFTRHLHVAATSVAIALLLAPAEGRGQEMPIEEEVTDPLAVSPPSMSTPPDAPSPLPSATESTTTPTDTPASLPLATESVKTTMTTTTPGVVSTDTLETEDAEGVFESWRFAVGARIPALSNTGTFSPDLGFEVSPLRRLWLTARVGGRVDVGSAQGQLLPPAQVGMRKSADVFAAVGVRWVMNPEHRVQGFFSAEGQTALATLEPAFVLTGSDAIPAVSRWGNGKLSLGGGLEARVFDELFLRVSSDVISAGAEMYEYTSDNFTVPFAPEAALSSAGAYLSIQVVPSVAIFYRF